MTQGYWLVAGVQWMLSEYNNRGTNNRGTKDNNRGTKSLSVFVSAMPLNYQDSRLGFS